MILWRIHYFQAEKEMRRRMELIHQIRAMEAVPIIRQKFVDLTATSGHGLLSEMSIAEVWLEILFSHIHRVLHTNCPKLPAWHPHGGELQATWPVSCIKWLWRHRLTCQNGNVVRLDSTDFSNVCTWKIDFGHIPKKKSSNSIISWEKSTNPRVKLTCPCLGNPKDVLS